MIKLIVDRLHDEGGVDARGVHPRQQVVRRRGQRRQRAMVRVCRLDGCVPQMDVCVDAHSGGDVSGVREIGEIEG